MGNGVAVGTDVAEGCGIAVGTGVAGSVATACRPVEGTVAATVGAAVGALVGLATGAGLGSTGEEQASAPTRANTTRRASFVATAPYYHGPTSRAGPQGGYCSAPRSDSA